MSEHPRRVRVTENPLNEATPLSALETPITPIDLVYVRNHFARPDTHPESWKLIVSGGSNGEIELSLPQLKAMPTVNQQITLECAGNGRIGMNPQPPGTPWGYGAVSVIEVHGTPLVGVLERAGISQHVIEVAFLGADQGEIGGGGVVNYTRSLPLDVAMDPGPLLVWTMNGQPLTADHGYPLRLVVPGWYGMAAVKWLREIHLLDEAFTGFFQHNHYIYSQENGTPEAEPVRMVRVRSLILGPQAGASMPGGDVEVHGVAWSGSGPITAVQVSADDGASWQTADLSEPEHDFAMQRWHTSFSLLDVKQYTLLSRATDAGDNIQPLEAVWNRLGYGNNAVLPVLINVMHP